MATYKEIIDYVFLNYGYRPKTCWIAHVKELNGLKVRKSNNRIDIENRKYPCPANKVNDIRIALEMLGEKT